ncbi:uncharacterized protein SPPG_02169 [Spizellomyces punctatus DAOM BR117]|uniref:BZIP domain-containing protein n=2 Tax=Spizellomyces punctatus (strain DAOM BR117) TaxID=645134 RepID=A0A0L0HNX9_SPIPD|nr:uncharacterized protein SPPG_02169 [Spizellomyces punctatus DAOM BR117]KND03106.1 hypothetical protein SPPG_02169 [Spizellomyces punctatus DAOM BR117]|eukprot:XP_016611145.1 hypothetical protein SPPG_02169 [Spizellomyces punctatus DAOM BR117]
MTNMDSVGPMRKKPGAKPNPFITDMVAHRKEKNRQAQKALRERRAQQAFELQNELRSLRSQVSSLGQERAQLRQENRQLQQLLALTFSSWLPEVAQEMADAHSHDAVMIAAKALAELQARPVIRQEKVFAEPANVKTYSPVPMDVTQTEDDTEDESFQEGGEDTFLPAIQSEWDDNPKTPNAEESSVITAHISHLPTPDPCPPIKSCCPPAKNPFSTTLEPPAAVENCAETMPCFVLREKILKYGRHIDLAALCDELVRRAVCHGNPWDPADWTVPPDLFERFPCMK